MRWLGSLPVPNARLNDQSNIALSRLQASAMIQSHLLASFILTSTVRARNGCQANHFSCFCQVSQSINTNSNFVLDDRLEASDIGSGEVRSNCLSSQMMQVVVHCCETIAAH